jgi:hypothetical protein
MTDEFYRKSILGDVIKGYMYPTSKNAIINNPDHLKLLAPSLDETARQVFIAAYVEGIDSQDESTFANILIDHLIRDHLQFNGIVSSPEHRNIIEKIIKEYSPASTAWVTDLKAYVERLAPLESKREKIVLPTAADVAERPDVVFTVDGYYKPDLVPRKTLVLPRKKTPQKSSEKQTLVLPRKQQQQSFLVVPRETDSSRIPAHIQLASIEKTVDSALSCARVAAINGKYGEVNRKHFSHPTTSVRVDDEEYQRIVVLYLSYLHFNKFNTSPRVPLFDPVTHALCSYESLARACIRDIQTLPDTFYDSKQETLEHFHHFLTYAQAHPHKQKFTS